MSNRHTWHYLALPVSCLTAACAPGLGGGTGPASSSRASPERVVRTFFERLEARDAEGVVALLDEDFVFRDAEGTFSVGREEMRPLLAWDAEARSRPEIEDLEVEGDTVRVRLREANRLTDLLELDPWELEASFVVRHGRILEEEARERVDEGAPSFSERFQRAIRPVAEWAAETDPEAARAVFEHGRVARYDGPTARLLLALLEAYPGPPGP